MSALDDPGVARERTALSWQRTAVAFAAVTVLLSLAALESSASWLLAPASAAAGGATVGAAYHGLRSYARRLSRPPAAAAAALRATCLATVATAIVAAAVTVLR